MVIEVTTGAALPYHFRVRGAALQYFVADTILQAFANWSRKFLIFNNGKLYKLTTLIFVVNNL